ncbi:MAG: GFA family protein [Rhodobacteraceae bacterium]|nr:GFA family protein [Paracoccaceae bacterium]
MIEGHCLCGAVRVRAETVPGWVGAWHCRMCQRWSGGVFACFPACGVTVEGPVTRHASSGFAERAFRAVCGSHLWMRDTDAPEGSCELMPGLSDKAADWPLRSEVYADCAMASMRLSGAERRATKAEYERKNPHVEGVGP